MAEGKKSFVLYSDLIHTLSQLSDKEAGELFKHILKYVNDENPKTKNKIVSVTFEPIKQQLKRDLDKWGVTREGRSKAGKASAKARELKKKQALTNPTSVKSVQQSSTNPTVSVTVNATVNVNENVKSIFNTWISYRKDISKSIINEKTLTSLSNRFNKESVEKVEFVVNNSIENNWIGLFWDKYEEQPKKIEKPKAISREEYFGEKIPTGL